MPGHRNTWRDSEVDALLKFGRTMPFSGSSGSYRGEAVYRKIVAEPAKHGVVCGWKQCCNKLKVLKKKYKKLLMGCIAVVFAWS